MSEDKLQDISNAFAVKMQKPIRRKIKEKTMKHKYDPNTMLCDDCNERFDNKEMTYIPRKNKFYCPKCKVRHPAEKFKFPRVTTSG